MSAAARMQKMRQRRAEGAVCVAMTLPPAAVMELRRLGWIAPDAPPDEAAGAAIRLLEAAFAVGLRPGAALRVTSRR